jgi:hypothetical protein
MLGHQPTEDPTNTQEQIFCFNGGPQEGVDDFFYNYCIDLPAWAAGSPNVTVTFLLHSNQSTDYLFIKNIALKGWVSGCSPSTPAALQETFAACDTSAWTLSGGTHTCNPIGCVNNPTWVPGIFGDGAPFLMDTTVDASALDTEVTACIRFGEVQPAAGDRIALRYDVGTGYQTAWAQDATMISFSSFAGDGSGNYDFTTTNVPGVSLDTTVTCQWDQDPTLTAEDSINF